MQLDSLETFAHTLADAAGGIVRRYFRQPLTVIDKDDHSPVTRADQETEEVLRELILKQYPSHGIIGEEGESIRPDAEYVWVLDPIENLLINKRV